MDISSLLSQQYRPETFETLFSPEAMKTVFEEKYKDAPSKGVDRLNGFQYSKRIAEDLKVVSEKCLSGKYRFSPYIETLKLKGRGTPPRLVSTPTIRDRIVLNQLNKVLASAFPNSVPRSIANSYVRDIAKDLVTVPDHDTYVCSCDIKTFYDSLQHDRLIKMVSAGCDREEVVSLVKHAILSPTVPKNTRRKQYSSFTPIVGVPQGLAISNILAAIYMAQVDTKMESLDVKYYRYVDDVLMYGTESHVKKAHQSLGGRLKRRGLSLHPLGSNKGQIAPLFKSFGYLGYIFKWPHITVRDSTKERLLRSLAAKFSDYSHNKARRIKRFKYLDEKRLREILVLELNERITGAVSEGKRYGWVAYFSQINDLSLLHELDHVVAGMFSRLPDFKGGTPKDLKKFTRAFYEMKYSPHSGYVHDYDALKTTTQKLSFLVERGRVGANESLTDDEICDRYERYRHHILKAMHADEGDSYG